MTENDDENNGDKLYAEIVKRNGQKWNTSNNLTKSKEWEIDMKLTDKLWQK